MEDIRIVQGDRLTFRGGSDTTSLCVDGAPIDPRRTIEASKYRPGIHFIDLYGRHHKKKVRFQFELEIVPSLMVVMPEPFVSLPKGSDELVASVRVVNQSPGACLVHAAVGSNAEGWTASIVGSPVKRLAAKKAVNFRIRARRSDQAPGGGAIYQPLGFNVAHIGAQAQPASGVLYVHA